jgi:phospholipid/cholesterol/gamma-HCH transport system ATP-binding protein
LRLLQSAAATNYFLFSIILMIELINVYKKLGEKQILHGVSFHVGKGETYVIIGRSGTGKSVTLKNIIGLLRPDAGQIKVMGTDVSHLTTREFYNLRNDIGVLFQSGALINWLNVEENVALPLMEHEKLPPQEVKRIVREKLSLVNLRNVEHLTTDTLSGGMKKRVGLARAIVRNPQIILYDEPTSGLDPVMSNQINELILSLQQKLGVTSICVTHDMESAYMIANKIGMLYEGKIIAEGTPEEIKNSKNAIVRQFIHGSTKGPLTDNIV